MPETIGQELIKAQESMYNDKSFHSVLINHGSTVEPFLYCAHSETVAIFNAHVQTTVKIFQGCKRQANQEVEGN